MFWKKKFKIEVVPAAEYTDFSERLKEAGNKEATVKTVVAASIIPAVASIGLVAHRFMNDTTTTVTPAAINAPVNVLSTPPIIEPVTLTAIPVNMTTMPQPTGFIADKSLETLAAILDPVVQIMVAISFPIASVIMIGACFFFMFGNNEKAWSMIMNAGLGYVLIQISPLFLEILREVGEAI